jgi:hypothetical protein
VLKELEHMMACKDFVPGILHVRLLLSAAAARVLHVGVLSR